MIVPSRTVADDLDPAGRSANGWPSSAPGVDPDRFAHGEPPATPPEILVLGALVDWKRPELAIEVLALARRQVPDLRLRFVGAPMLSAETVPNRCARGPANSR